MSDDENGQEKLAIVPRTPLSFELRNMDEAYRFAQALGRSGLLPDSLRGKPDDILVVIIVGRELGLSPMQAVRSINVVKGRPVMSADLQVALCVRARDVCEFFRLIESSTEVATYETKRQGAEPSRMSFTWAEAKMAGLTGKGNWQSYPAAMLRARCASALARVVYPDLVMGVYCEDEGDEIRGRAVMSATVVPPPMSVHGMEPHAPSPDAKVIEVAAPQNATACAGDPRDDGPIDTTAPERVPGEDDDGPVDAAAQADEFRMCVLIDECQDHTQLRATAVKIKLFPETPRLRLKERYSKRWRELETTGGQR